MEVGIVAPIRFLRKYCTLTKVQYCLARLIVEEEEYRNFYIGRQKAGDYIILDTVRLGWRRQPEEYSIIAQALKLIYPSLVVYPSFMYNTLKTISEAERFTEAFRVVGAACLEGPDLDSIAYCKSQIVPKYTFAIPSHMIPVCPAIENEKPTIYIDNYLSIEELTGLAGMLVTSLPFRLGALGRLTSDYLPSPPALDFYSQEDKFPGVVERNIRETVVFYGGKNEI